MVELHYIDEEDCIIERPFNKLDTLNSLADLLMGRRLPMEEADYKFLESVNQLFEEKKNARNTELRMYIWPQIPEGEQQGSSEVSTVQEDV